MSEDRAPYGNKPLASRVAGEIKADPTTGIIRMTLEVQPRAGCEEELLVTVGQQYAQFFGEMHQLRSQTPPVHE